MRQAAKRLLLAGGLAGALLVFGAAIWLMVSLYALFNNPFNDSKFDREVWLEFADNDDPDNPRGGMACDVRRIVLSKGKRKAEVLSLLGEPDFAKDEQVFKYNLGMWSGFRIDYDSLDVRFDAHGKAVEVQIVQH